MTDALPEPARATCVIDGMIVDEETGEVIGVQGKPAFAVTDEGSLHWFLQKVMALDAKVAAVTTHPDVAAAQSTIDALETEEVKAARAVLANVAGITADLQKRRASLIAWQAQSVIATARELLAAQHGAGKTLKTIYGSVSLRSAPATVRVREGVDTSYSCRGNEETRVPDVITWAHLHHPESVKTTEEFMVSALPSELLKPVLDDDGDYVLPDVLPVSFFTVEKPREKLTITTGVGDAPAAPKKGTRKP